MDFSDKNLHRNRARDTKELQKEAVGTCAEVLNVVFKKKRDL